MMYSPEVILIMLYSLILLKLVDSIFCHYHVKERTDVSLLCQRVEYLETEIKELKDTMIDVSKQVDIQTCLQAEYVKLDKHHRDIQSLKDHTTILEKDIQKLRARPHPCKPY